MKVSELPFKTTEEDLRKELQKLFSPYGEIKITFTDEGGDQSRTAAVQLKNEETAVRAVKELRGERVQGALFRIDIDRLRRKRIQPPP